MTKRKEINEVMLLKVIGLIAVKEIFNIIYLVCREILETGRRRWTLAGCGCLMTLLIYLIFRTTGYKHPIVCTALTSCPWAAIYDIIRKKRS